jgi:hypothetical protein
MREERLLSSSSLSASSTCFLMSLAKRREATFEYRDCSRPNALIREMYAPYSGLIQVSSAPLRAALAHLGQQPRYLQGSIPTAIVVRAAAGLSSN